MTATMIQQFRAAALGFWPGTPGDFSPKGAFDGVAGPKTLKAVADATAAQRKLGRPFIHPTGLHRVHWHWSAGSHKASVDDREHYHWMFEDDGRELACNIETAHLAHTLNANTGAIGLSLCGMRLANEKPFYAGPEPITPAAIVAMVRRTATICHAYDIPISRWSTLSHAEVQPTLGIRQKGKWDIAWLPGRETTDSPILIGDWLREQVRIVMKANGWALPLGSDA